MRPNLLPGSNNNASYTPKLTSRDLLNFSNLAKRNLSSLKYVKNVFIPKNDISGFKPNDAVLSATHNVPYVGYYPKFQKLIKEHHGINLDLKSLLPSKEDIIKEDDAQISTYSKFTPNFPRGINFNLLITSFLVSCDQLGMSTENGTELFGRKPLSDSMLEYDQSTSAAYPTMSKKRSNSARTQSMEFCTGFLERPSLSRILRQPCVLFHRLTFKLSSDFSDLTMKIRQVWAVPYSILTLQNHVYGSVLDNITYKQLSMSFPVTTQGRTLSQISDLLRNLCFRSSAMVSIDVKKMDSNVPSWFLVLFHTQLQLITDSSYENSDRLKRCLMIFDILTPFVSRDNSIHYMGQGNVSGGKFTSIINSLLTLTILNYCSLKYSGGVRTIMWNALVLGDDNLCSLKYFSSKQLMDTYSLFGLSVHQESSDIITDFNRFDFLGYIWDYFRPTHEINWFITRFCISTRFFSKYNESSLEEYFTFRAICISSLSYNGLSIFRNLLGQYLKTWKDLVSNYRSGRPTFVKWYSDDPYFEYSTKIPFDYFLNLWPGTPALE